MCVLLCFVFVDFLSVGVGWGGVGGGRGRSMVLNEGALNGGSVACCSGFGQGKGKADRLRRDVHVLVHKAAQALVDEQSHRRLCLFCRWGDKASRARAV